MALWCRKYKLSSKQISNLEHSVSHGASDATAVEPLHSRQTIAMVGTAKKDIGKGKGKGKSRADVGGSAMDDNQESERVTTPRRAPPGESRLTLASGGDYGGDGKRTSRIARLAWLYHSDPVVPRRRTVCVLAVAVAVLAALRTSLLPPVGVPQRVISVEQDDELVRLVLAEELKSVADQLQSEKRSFEGLMARQADALEELKGFEEKLELSASHMKELEGLGQAMREDSTGDAGLTTQVNRENDLLHEFHKSVTRKLDHFRRQLEEQAGTMREVRSGLSTIVEQAKLSEQETAASVDDELEAMLMDNVRELEEVRAMADERVGQISSDVLTSAELKDLLEDAARSAEQSSSTKDDKGRLMEHMRVLSRKAVSASRGKPVEAADSCVSQEHLIDEVEYAIKNLASDGTGLRDYANVAVGGQVLTSGELVSNTYTPPSWWGPSRYWHKAGVENGIGPVTSVISEDSSLGACWGMSGSKGHVTILLPREITVDAVSLEHASRLVTIDSTSAPAKFEVYGMKTTSDKYPTKLGSATYDLEGKPIQTFQIKPLGRKFKIIQFRIMSNWGNPQYTCIYRLRVHGKEAGS